MYNIEIIEHKNISFSKILDIIDIKSKAWDYPFDKQLQWIETNITNNDLHILLLYDSLYVGYLNLIDINLQLNGGIKKGYGVGNVCSLEKGKGYGRKLMELTNKFIEEREKIGLLFCKFDLVEFYKNNNWQLIDKKKLSISFNNDKIETMLYNSDIKCNELVYKGRIF